MMFYSTVMTIGGTPSHSAFPSGLPYCFPLSLSSHRFEYTSPSGFSQASEFDSLKAALDTIQHSIEKCKFARPIPSLPAPPPSLHPTLASSSLLSFCPLVNLPCRMQHVIRQSDFLWPQAIHQQIVRAFAGCTIGGKAITLRKPNRELEVCRLAVETAT